MNAMKIKTYTSYKIIQLYIQSTNITYIFKWYTLKSFMNILIEVNFGILG